MELFSHRKGIKPPKSKIQTDSMDDDLRNSLWNALLVCYWDKLKSMNYINFYTDFSTLFERLWLKYFKYPLDTLDALNGNWPNNIRRIRKNFFECEWYEVYDFIEFVVDNCPNKSVNKEFIEKCNIVLESELSAYRFVGGKIIPITSEEEILAIEEAIKVPIDSVREHLNRSLELLSDRKKPDYRNSIKEAISAVESICKLISGSPKAKLSNALEEIEKKLPFHKAFKSALSNLYGYTSNAEGIRHSIMDQPKLSLEDARFMLVICSSFVNYLKAKAEKAGINL